MYTIYTKNILLTIQKLDTYNNDMLAVHLSTFTLDKP